jgi:hypothetical protein
MHTYLYDEKPKEESERKNIIFSVFDSFFSLYALLFIKSNNRIARENTFTTPNPLVMVVSGKKKFIKNTMHEERTASAVNYASENLTFTD